MIRKVIKTIVIAVLIAAVLPISFIHAVEQEADPNFRSPYQQGREPVTSYFTSATTVSTLDPARAEDALSVNWIENLFLGLTNNNPLNNFEIMPELATSWTTADAQHWTFTIRTDVPWVRYDPETGKAEKLRNVVAGDIEYAIKRACDPRLGSRYSSIIAGVIAGCNEINNMDSSEVTDELLYSDTIQVDAPDDATLNISLRYAAPFFFAMSTLWTLRPVYREAVEEYGDNWTDPGIIVTNGPYMLEELVPNVRRVAVINPYMPQDLRGPGNVERLEISNVRDANTNYSLYLADQVDISGIPPAELENARNDPELSPQIVGIPSSTVSYIAFDHAKPPFDDVHLRRAFSAIIDREAYLQQVSFGQGEIMHHFTPPGMLGAPPALTDPGVGFNVEYAQQQLALSRYPNCEGLPPISVATGQNGADTFEFVKTAAQQYLGCDPNLFTVEELEFSVLLELTAFDQPVQNRPHMWTLGWGPDYPDANNWVGDVISCFKDNDFLRSCTEVDDLIEAAARELDPERRNQMYFEIEAALFGRVENGQVVVDGEVPFIPLAFGGGGLQLVKPWYEGPFATDGVIGGNHWDWRTVDQEMQLQARND